MYRTVKIPAFFLILLLAFCVNKTLGQEYLNKADRHEQKRESVKVVFTQIEKGITSGNINELAEYLSPQTYLSLANGISGYYSSNQAFYVLEDFFRTYQVTGFKLDDVQVDEGNVYGTGKYNFVMRGKRESANVYISFRHNGKKWKITQLTIN